MNTTATKTAKAYGHAEESLAAARRVLEAIENGENVSLRDAKILEAAGCYIRRNVATN